MLRLSTFCSLLMLGAAQNGYDYNRPGKPFNPETTPGRPNTGAGPTNGYPTSPTAASYPSGPQRDEYSGSSPPSGFPTTNQGYPLAGQRPQQGFPGSGPSYQGQGQTTGPGGFTGQPTGGYTGNNNGATGQSPGGYTKGSGQNYPGQTGPQGGSGFGQGGSGYGDGSSGSSGFDGSDNGLYEGGDYSAIPGEPDRDYPILSEIPETSFRCDAQPYPGYYADVEARCQVFHVCANNRTFDFLCPNGTIFSQEVFVCVWWNQFDCNSAPSFFELNANLYAGNSQASQGQGYGGSGTGYSQNPSYPTGGGPSVSYSPGQTATDYPGTELQGTYPQGPTTSYPSQGLGNAGPSGSSGSFTGETGPQRPTQSYPGSQGTQFSGTQPSYPSRNQGYPAGRPSGPSFITGTNNERPVSTPNREYLPPKN